MARPEDQKCKQYMGDSSQGMRYPLVPLWGSKIEVVAPKCRFRTQILEMCSGKTPSWCWFQEKQHLNGFLPEHFCRAPKFVLHLPTEQCLNSAPKSYLCYGSWLRICQLFTVLTGVIFKSLIMLSRTWVGLVGTSHLKEHLNLNILAMSDFRFL